MSKGDPEEKIVEQQDSFLSIRLKPIRWDKFTIYLGEISLGDFSLNDLYALWRYKPGTRAKHPKIYKMIINELTLLFPKWNVVQMREYTEQYQDDIRTDFLNWRDETKTANPTEILPDNVSFSDIIQHIPNHHRYAMEVIMCVIISPKGVENPVWLTLISPPSFGKTFLLELFDHPSIARYVDDFTENSLAPGKPNMDAADVSSLLDIVEDLSLIMGDMSSIFNMRKEKVQKYLGSITAAYGGKYYKHSPGTGIILHNSHCSILMGMTIETYKKHRALVNQLGNRFLSLKLNRGHVGYEQGRKYDKNDLRRAVCGFVKQKKPLPLAGLSEEVREYLEEFCEVIVTLRSLLWARTWNDIEGSSRLFQEMGYMVQVRALIHDRYPEIGDVDFFKQIAHLTIGNIGLIHKIYEGCEKPAELKSYLRRMITAGEGLDIIDGIPEEAGSIIENDTLSTSKKIYKTVYRFFGKWHNEVEDILVSCQWITDVSDKAPKIPDTNPEFEKDKDEMKAWLMKLKGKSDVFYTINQICGPLEVETERGLYVIEELLKESAVEEKDGKYKLKPGDLL